MAQQAQGKTFHYKHYHLCREAILGTGAYGQVYKAKLDELPCAAKLLHPILVDRTDSKNQINLRKFEQECHFLSEIRHPNIVQYLGMVQDRLSGLPVLLMELMDENLTHFLERSEKTLPYHLQVDISQDTALALAYLHSNNIIHRDLSSNNVLLIGPGYRAKVTDFGMSKLTEMHSHMTPLTKCPGTAAYMAPEALQDEPVYSAKLDMFQAGVLMIQIITRKFPDPDRPTRRIEHPHSPTGIFLVPVPEAERRQHHLSLIPQTHPMLHLVLGCIKDRDIERPTAQHICQQLSTLKEAPQYIKSHQDGWKIGSGEIGGSGREREDGRNGKDEIERRVAEVGRREKEVERREDEIKRRETEFQRRVMEVGRRETEVTEILSAKDEELRQEREEKEQMSRRHQQVENQLKEERDRLLNEERKLLQLLAEKEEVINGLSLSAASFTCHISGPGLSATANHPTHVIVELSDDSNQPCSLRLNITTEMQSVDQSSVVPTTVSMRSPSQYEVSFTALNRGQHKLLVQLNGSEFRGSPLNITVYPDPTEVWTPVRVVTGLAEPYFIAINNRRGEIVVSNFRGHTVSLLDREGKEIQKYGSKGNKPGRMMYPTGVAVDSDDNVYVASDHRLQKFSRDGHLIKCVGRHGSKDGQFSHPRGIKIHHGYVYVCDRYNNRIQVFDTDLNFIRTIGSFGSERGQFIEPYDIDFDIEGKVYISDSENDRIQVIDTTGQFLQQFGQEEGGEKLKWPTAVHVMGQFVYILDQYRSRITVYETSGQFVISFKHCDLGNPCGITSDYNGLIYVTDFERKIHIF